MTDFQFIIIIVAGIPAIICLACLLYYLCCYLEERFYNKRFEDDFLDLTWCCCIGDHVRSKECDGNCETCKHFFAVEDLK